VEKVKKFELLTDEWSVDSGELTPTMKVKRKVVIEKYDALIESIYNV
jgi:long-chain acyl-CoA synthetase